MPDYLFLMHHLIAESEVENCEPDWGPYLATLRATGKFQGGSAIGAGACVRKSGLARAVTSPVAGFIRVTACDLDEARALLEGNPVFENGGTVEIRELPRTDQASEARGFGDGQLASLGNEKPTQNKSMDGSIIHACSMVRSAFDDVDLSEAAFTNVNLRDAKFENVNLAGVAIKDANLDGLTIFRGCTMVQSAFDDVDLSETIFTNVNLRGAKFENVNLARVAINDANIEGLTIFGHNIQTLIRAELARREDNR